MKKAEKRLKDKLIKFFGKHFGKECYFDSMINELVDDFSQELKRERREMGKALRKIEKKARFWQNQDWDCPKCSHKFTGGDPTMMDIGDQLEDLTKK